MHLKCQSKPPTKAKLTILAGLLAAFSFVGVQSAAAEDPIASNAETLTVETLETAVTPAGTLEADTIEADSVITNGFVSLGVNQEAQLIVPRSPGGGLVGVMLNETGHDGVRAGCSCEGWGAGALPHGPTSQGGANNAYGGRTPNLIVKKFIANEKDAESVVIITGTDTKGVLQVTHFFKPSAHTPWLYQIDVTLRNISDVDMTDVRYTRVMDWDVEPTPFRDIVTLISQGAPPHGSARPDPLRYSDDNGFVRGLPFESRFPLNPLAFNTDFNDLGPQDHGALFDYSFVGRRLGSEEVLKPGQSKKLTIFYGAAPTEAAALEAIAAEGVDVWSFGQNSLPGGAQTGAPATFIFGYDDDDGREGDSGNGSEDPVGNG